MSTAETLPGAATSLGATTPSLPSGGLRQCFRHPSMLCRWFLSRRFRHAVEVRKHVWKIRNFQRDELSAAAVAGIDEGIRAFDRVLRSGPDRAQLEAGMVKLEESAQKWLRPYAHASIRENVEVFLVAIGVAMAIRTFFLQPFKIPTGSMQPTLYGVHFEDLRDRPDVATPGMVRRVFSGVLRGTFHHELIAEADGQVLGIQPRGSRFMVKYQDIVVRYAEGGRTWDKSHRIWFSPVDGHNGDLTGLRGVLGWERPEPFQPLRPGQTFRKGEVLLRLRDSAGDHLFVDRLTYNFRPPQRGEIIVFETRGIHRLPPDQFYIKRLVALGGERVRLGDDRRLVIDGQPLDATTPHFGKVYGFSGPPAESEYSGHLNGTVFRAMGRPFQDVASYFPNGSSEIQVGPDRYMVMGDNTMNSFDSRGWGDFPKTNVVGKYCFVWWPFTSRWGSRVD
ncbi:MAG: signal peptidase I [Verrucomicrobiae bacterium]|nr:signal peptidase I [Verrucomicrobiae bacterium]